MVEKKTAVKKAAGKKAKPNPALKQKFKPDAKLAAVVGSKPRARSEFLSDLWTFFKKHNLQDPNNGQHILVGKNKLTKDLVGKEMITMFEVMSVIGKHIQ